MRRFAWAVGFVMATVPVTVTAESPALGTIQGGFIAGDGWIQVLVYNYNTGGSQVLPAAVAPYDFDYALPARNWIGAFLYDYTLSQFTWGMYNSREPLPIVL